MLTFCRHLPAQKVTVTRQAIGKTQKNALIVGLLLSPLQSAVWHTGRWHEPVHPSWNIIYQCALLLPSTNTTKYWGLPNGPIGDGAAGRWSGKCRPCAPATAGLNAAGSVVNGLPDSLVQKHIPRCGGRNDKEILGSKCCSNGIQVLGVGAS